MHVDILFVEHLETSDVRSCNILYCVIVHSVYVDSLPFVTAKIMLV